MAERFRIGVILCRGPVRRWQRDCIGAIAALDKAQIALTVELDNVAPLRLPGGSRAGVEARGDAAAVGVPVLSTRAIPDGAGGHRLGEADRAAIAGHTLDVLIDLTGLRLAPGVEPIARHGVWAFHHGDPRRGDGLDPGFREVLAGEHATACILYRAGDGGEAEVLREGWFKTRQTPRRNADSVLLRPAGWPALVLEAMAELRADPVVERRLRLLPAAMPPPSPADRLRVVGRILAAAGDSLRRRLCRERWTVGIVHQPIAQAIRARRLDPPRWLTNQPDDRFYADPFPLRRSAGRTEVLVEAARYAEPRGYLARIVIGANMTAGGESEILRTQEHLSYPFVLRDEGATRVIPESWQADRLAAYRIDPDSGALLHDGDLMVGMAVVDPTLVHHDGRWYLFCCDRHDQDTTNLYLFHAAHWRGPWLPHPHNPVKIDVRSARPAGAILRVDGTLYRPAQDCALRYGNAVAVNRILELSARRFREEVAFVLRPAADGPYPDGLHTLNGLDDVTVVDGQKLSFEPLAAIADRVARRRNRRRRQ